MAQLQQIPYIEMLEIMIVETQNELQKTEILERIATRQRIEGMNVDMMLGQMQMKIKSFNKTIDTLKDFHTEALAKENK